MSLAALLTTACSAQLHESALRREDWQQPLWHVHCETAESHEPLSDEGPGAHHRKWIWAKAASGQPVLLKGHLEDGFLVVEAVQLGSGKNAPSVPATLHELRSQCQQTLLRDHADKSLELGQVRAALPEEEIHVPLVLPATTDEAYPISRLVIFGDSLSDNGRLKQRLVVFPGAPYWIGRFSNGPIWSDYLEMGQNLAIQNHSMGGAAVTPHEHKPGENIVALVKQGGQLFVSGSLDQQIADYIHNNLAAGRVQRPDTTAFVLWIGANDYIWKEPFSGQITTFLNSPQGAAGYRQVVDEVIAALDDNIIALYDAGARNFLVLNLPDIGDTPIVLQNETYLAPHQTTSQAQRQLELSRRLSALTAYHNESLTQLLLKLRRKYPEADFQAGNSAAVVQGWLHDEAPANSHPPFDYGFNLEANREVLVYEDVEKSFQKPCYSGGYLGTGDNDKVCAVARASLFWDVIHPTTYAHCWYAYAIRQSLASNGWTAPPETPEVRRQWCEGNNW